MEPWSLFAKSATVAEMRARYLAEIKAIGSKYDAPLLVHAKCTTHDLSALPMTGALGR